MSWTLYEVTTHQTIQTTFYVEVDVPEGDQPEAPYWEAAAKNFIRDRAAEQHVDRQLVDGNIVLPEHPHYWEVSVEVTDRKKALKHHGTLIDYVKFHEGGDPTLTGSD